MGQKHKGVRDNFVNIERDTGYCRFGNFRENLIFANIREFTASRIKVLANIDLLKSKLH